MGQSASQKKKQGILVALDRKYQWLLPSFWKSLRAHCSLDVAFIDLGMDTKGKSWAKKRGLYIDRSTHVSQFKEKEPPAFLIKKWKEIMQGDISIFRPYWFAKPLALCCTPFQHTLYLDVDCEVKSPLEDVFLSLEANDCALCQESFAWHELLVQQGLKSPLERTWNSGVIAYHCHCPLIIRWMERSLRESHLFMGDQDLLARIIYEENHSPAILPMHWNWKASWGPNSSAKIYHWSGGINKLLKLNSL
ncbi:MAG: hypothetical protein Tsb0015_00210 [Simkaniaceae bacterium]